MRSPAKKIEQLLSFLLTKGDQFTKTDLTQLVKGGFWLTLGQGAATITGLLVTVVLANILTTEAFGGYKYLLSLYGFITVFSLSGMAIAVTRATANGKEGTLRYATSLSLLWGLVMTGIALAASGYYFYHGNLLLGWSLGLMSLFAPLMQSLSLYAAFVNGKKDYRTYSFFSLSYSVFPPLILIGTAFLTQNIFWLFAAFLVTETVVNGIHYFITLRKYQPNDIIDKATTGYGKHVSLMNIIGNVSFQLDKILVWNQLGATPLALYAIATAPPQQLRYLNKILGVMALPRFSTRSIAELQKSMGRKVLILFSISVAIVLTYWFAAPYLYQLLFPKYLDAILYSQIFSLIILFFPAVLFQEALNAHMCKRELYIVQTTIPILKILSFFILLPLFGIWGVFGSMFLAEITRMTLVVYFFYTLRSV